MGFKPKNRIHGGSAGSGSASKGETSDQVLARLYNRRGPKPQKLSERTQWAHWLLYEKEGSGPIAEAPRTTSRLRAQVRQQIQPITQKPPSSADEVLSTLDGLKDAPGCDLSIPAPGQWLYWVRNHSDDLRGLLLILDFLDPVALRDAGWDYPRNASFVDRRVNPFKRSLLEVVKAIFRDRTPHWRELAGLVLATAGEIDQWPFECGAWTGRVSQALGDWMLERRHELTQLTWNQFRNLARPVVDRASLEVQADREAFLRGVVARSLPKVTEREILEGLSYSERAILREVEERPGTYARSRPWVREEARRARKRLKRLVANK